jgi:hypothetical protein
MSDLQQKNGDINYRDCLMFDENELAEVIRNTASIGRSVEEV